MGLFISFPLSYSLPTFLLFLFLISCSLNPSPQPHFLSNPSSQIILSFLFKIHFPSFFLLLSPLTLFPLPTLSLISLPLQPCLTIVEQGLVTVPILELGITIFSRPYFEQSSHLCNLFILIYNFIFLAYFFFCIPIKIQTPQESSLILHFYFFGLFIPTFPSSLKKAISIYSFILFLLWRFKPN